MAASTNLNNLQNSAIAMETLMNSLISSGDTLNSRYRILHQLGHGGFGRTYLAEDINRFNERCVLKEFAPRLQGSFALEKAQQLFEREAGILYRLQHPQIPKFRELFRDKHADQDRLLFVQDYVEGHTYHALCNQRAEVGSPFTEAEISHLICKTLPVLEYIHSMGVIHRDISPDNMILRNIDGLPVLIDFGSIKEVANRAQSQLMEAAPKPEPLSPLCTAIGKQGYAPPEQVEQGIAFAHSDLYALAATAIVLLTGKEPRRLIDPNSYRWRWPEDSILNPKLQWVLTTMLSPTPSDRFGSATEVIKILQEIAVFATPMTPLPPAPNPTTGPIYSPQPPNSRAPTPLLSNKALLLAPIVATIVIGGILGLTNQNPGRVPTPPTNPDQASEPASQLAQRFSRGERGLISQTTTPEKELAVAAFAQGKYSQAATLLSASLKTLANDPEAVIYLNNARIGDANAYSIAVSIPIGSDVNGAQEILRGVAQAQTQVNQAGGIDGVPLKVQIINDDNDPEVAKQAATALSQDPNILGVVGHYASDVTLATAPIYDSGQLVAISPVSTSIKLSNFSPYVFRTVPSDHTAARALADYMLKTPNQKNVSIFFSSESNYSESLKSEFVTAVSLGGGQVVSEFDLADPNFNAVESVKQAMRGGAEALMLAANTGALDRALQVVHVNRQQLSLLGGDDVYTSKTLQIAGELAEGMVLAIPWHIDSSPNNEFVKASKRLWRADVNWRTAMAYDAAIALIAAIEQNPTRVGVQQTLSDPEFAIAGASRNITFLSSGDRPKGIQLVKIKSSGLTPNEYVFEPVSDSDD